MQTKDLILNDCSQWQVVKQVSQVLPNIGVAILAKTLIVKAVHLSDLATLVVSTQDCDAVFKSNFQTNQQSDCLNWVVPAIYVVTHKKIVGVRWAATNLEQLHQVVELAMNISTDSDWALYRLDIGLIL